MKKLWKNVQQHQAVYYGLSWILGGSLTLLFFLFFGQSWITQSSILFAISLSVARFIAGLGLPLTWATGTIYLLKYLSPRYKGKEKKAERLITFLDIGAILLIFAMIGWQLTTLFIRSFRRTLISAVGIVVFMVSTYILPTWRTEFPSKQEEGLLTRVKSKFTTLARKVKKDYWRYLRKDILRAYLPEYIIFRSRFDEHRGRIAWLMLLPISLGLLPLPIISLPTIFLWFTMKKRPQKEYAKSEKLLLVIILCSSTVYLSVTLSPLFPISIPTSIMRLLWTLPYILGACVAFYLYSSSTIWKRLLE